WWVLLLLLLAGVVAGWWFFEEGENHVEDFIIAKIPNHPTAITIAVVATGITIGITAGLLSVVVMLLSGGSWAIGDLNVVGPPDNNITTTLNSPAVIPIVMPVATTAM